MPVGTDVIDLIAPAAVRAPDAPRADAFDGPSFEDHLDAQVQDEEPAPELRPHAEAAEQPETDEPREPLTAPANAHAPQHERAPAAMIQILASLAAAAEANTPPQAPAAEAVAQAETSAPAAPIIVQANAGATAQQPAVKTPRKATRAKANAAATAAPAAAAAPEPQQPASAQAKPTSKANAAPGAQQQQTQAPAASAQDSCAQTAAPAPQTQVQSGIEAAPAANNGAPPIEGGAKPASAPQQAAPPIDGAVKPADALKQAATAPADASAAPQPDTEASRAAPKRTGAASANAAAPAAATQAAKENFAALLAQQTEAPQAPQAPAAQSTPISATTSGGNAASLNSAHAAAHPPPTAQVAREIVRRHTGESTRFELRLDPPELGRVEVRLEVSRDHRVTAVVAADSPQALAELTRHARDLEQTLQSAGLELSENGLSFDLSQSGQGRDQAFEATPPAAGGQTAEPETPSIVRASPLGLESWRGQRIDLVA